MGVIKNAEYSMTFLNSISCSSPSSSSAVNYSVTCGPAERSQYVVLQQNGQPESLCNGKTVIFATMKPKISTDLLCYRYEVFMFGFLTSVKLIQYSNKGAPSL